MMRARSIFLFAATKRPFSRDENSLFATRKRPFYDTDTALSSETETAVSLIAGKSNINTILK